MKTLFILAATLATTTTAANADAPIDLAGIQYKVIVDDTLNASRAITLAMRSPSDKEEITLQLGINSQRTKAYTLDCVVPYAGNETGALVLTSYDIKASAISFGSGKILAVEKQGDEPCNPSYKRMLKPSAGSAYQLKAVAAYTNEQPADFGAGNFIFFDKK